MHKIVNMRVDLCVCG